ALIPFGLHHVFYMPFWQTELGGTVMIDGNMISGAQNIFFAELASKGTEHFSVSATRFMTGKFPVMIFGLPAAAFAMYKVANPEKKKQVGGLLLSAALTSMITGITEPLEFTFLFVAPLMYAVHCVLTGISYMIMHLLNVTVGMTFSGGVIDLTLFGILQGNNKTNWLWIIFVGGIYAVIYFFVFYYMIKKFDYKTPGREEGEQETKLYTRKDLEARKNNSKTETSELILNGLGGKENVSDIDCCATRLRVTVIDSELVSDELLKQSGASGVVRKGNGVQVIYGPKVSVIKSNLEDFMESDDVDRSYEVHEVQMEQRINEVNEVQMEQRSELASYMNGTVIPLEKVEDEVFSQKIIGDGIAIEPDVGELYSPCDGKVEMVFDTKHAVNLVSDDGCEILLHIGIDTVKLGGKYFEAHVSDGQEIHKGDLLISFKLDSIRSEGYKTTTPLIICNTDDCSLIESVGSGKITVGESLLKLEK
ncbi:MAG: PTS glucose transporter subunit IIA, partial [Lachnospiraceae bacterium]|nr:PTS glucose transporter subunit IIA [Lachnospiraceae bacterium]